MSEFGSVNFQSISIVRNYNNNGGNYNGDVDYGVDYGEDINNGDLNNRGNYCATLSFQGRDDKNTDKQVIQKDIYVSARLYGKTVREVLEESLNFIIENNINI